MPSKGKPTLSQKKKKLLVESQVNPDAYLSSDVKSRYIDSARILELNGSWPESLAIRIFGPTLMGSVAFALDNLAQFKNSFRVISKPTRTVTKGVHAVDTHENVRRHTVHTRNYIIIDDDPPLVVPEFVVDISDEEFVRDPLKDIGIPDYFGESRRLRVEEFQADSTQKQRYRGQVYGTLERLQKVSGNWTQERFILKGTQIDYGISATYGLGDVLFDKYVTTDTVDVIGATAVPAEWVYVDDEVHGELKQISLDIAETHLPDFVVKCLANKRFFEGFYQLGELKDLPKLTRSVADLARFFQQLSRSPLKVLGYLDKRLGGFYLSYLFGYKSVADAVKDLMQAPERLAKHMNYILSRNNKVYTGRFSKTFFEPPPVLEYDPVPLYYQPTGCYEVAVSDVLEFTYDVRCVVNQTIAFPPVMVPKFRDKTYREFLGLNPRVSDFYNLIPFTWLTDWFSGLSSYIKMLEHVTDEKLLVNFGFMTVVLRPKFKFSQIVELSDQTVILHADGSVDTEFANVRQLTLNNEYSYEYTRRMDISELNGEHSVASTLYQLTSDQLKILGALLTKFT